MEPPVVAGSVLARFKVWLQRKNIEMVASSKHFTETYLRRHFSCYNGELWLEDIPHDVQVLVCLAELDEIGNTSKVIRKQIKLHNERRVGPQIKLLHLQLSEHVCEQEEKSKAC
jgi:hypothetical protein